MTREEAIAILNHNVSACLHGTEWGEALEMAIKALEQEPKILDTLDFAIDASNGDTNYFVGFRNGLRYSKSLIDGKEPQFESCAEQEPKTDVLDKIRSEIELNRNEWIKGKDAEWHTYDRCLFIIDKYKAEEE